jgi:hypothetical protein
MPHGRQCLLIAAYLLLLVLAVPWYWPADDARMLLGLPLWVVVVLGTGLAAAALTAWVLLRYPWPDPADPEP